MTRWWSDVWKLHLKKNHGTVNWHSFVRFTIPPWMESCNRHFVHTLVASPTMAFERQTAVRAAGQSSTAVKVVVLFELRQRRFSIMAVSLQCKEAFVRRPCLPPGPRRLFFLSQGFWTRSISFFLPLFFFVQLSVRLSAVQDQFSVQCCLTTIV